MTGVKAARRMNSMGRYRNAATRSGEDIDVDDSDGEVDEHAQHAARLVLRREVERVEDVLSERRQELVEDLRDNHKHSE